MSDYKLPDLPSDDELGITEEDLRALEESEGGPEPGRKPAGPPPAGDAGGPPGGEDPDDERVFRWGGPLMLLLIVGLGWTASIRTGLPEPVPAEAPDTTFSAVRAGTMLEEIVRAPRPTGSPEHARVRAYLVDRLGSLGLEPEVQTTTAVLQGDGFARAATVRNVVARVPGADPTGAILLTAHYDGTELSPGAGDNASGLVTVLEALRAVLARTPLRNDIVVLFSDAEEIGLLGADAFARDHPSMQNVEVVVSFEMRGSGGPSILFETADGNGAVVRALDAANPRVFGTSLGEEFFRYMPHGTDFTVFERAGKPGLNFAAIDNASVYHTPRDLPSALSSHTLQHHGDHASGALRALGSLDLSEIRAPDVVYFTVPGLGLVVYPAGWVLPLSGLLVLSAVGAFFVARRRGARTAGIVAGFGVAIVAIALGYGAGYLMVDQASGAHLEAGRLPGALFYGEGWYVLALAAATLFVVLLLLRLARRRLSLIELTLGAVIVPLAAAIGLSVAAPLAAMQLQWPTLAALVVSTLLALLGTRSESWLGWIVALLLAVPVLFLLVPAVELLWLAATLRHAGALGALMVVGLLLVLPAVETLRAPNGWWAPLLALVIGAGCLGMARLGSDVSAVTPIPTTLAYAYERGAERGVWITDEPTASAEPESALGTWLAARTGTPFDRTLDLGDVGYRNGSTPVADAPPAAATPLTLVIRQDTTVGIVRRVTLAIRSEIGAERLHFQPSGGAGGTRIVSVNGRPLTDPFAARWVDHWGVPDPLVVLELEMPAGSPIDLAVSEHHLRPAEILGPGTFQRPPGLEADVLRWSDRAILTTRVQATETGALDPTVEPEAPVEAVPVPTDPTPGTPGDADGDTLEIQGPPGAGARVDTLTGPGSRRFD